VRERRSRCPLEALLGRRVLIIVSIKQIADLDGQREEWLGISKS
jgi:hypothetical protein